MVSTVSKREKAPGKQRGSQPVQKPITSNRQQLYKPAPVFGGTGHDDYSMVEREALPLGVVNDTNVFSQSART